MGTCQSGNQRNIMTDWQTIDHFPSFNIIRNKQTNHLAEIRRFQLDAKYSPENQMKIYWERGNFCPYPTVQVYEATVLDHLSSKTSKQVCGTLTNLAVITERIERVLEDLPQLTFPESLLILKKSLEGYEYLFKKTGPILVTSKMIGINSDGLVKVWVNQNFAKNYPQTEIPTLLKVRDPHKIYLYLSLNPQLWDEEQMLRNIIDLIEDKCEEGKFPNNLSKLIRDNCQSFHAVRKFLDKFIKTNDIYIPKIILRDVVRVRRKDYEEIRRRVDPFEEDRNLIFQKILQTSQKEENVNFSSLDKSLENSFTQLNLTKPKEKSSTSSFANFHKIRPLDTTLSVSSFGKFIEPITHTPIKSKTRFRFENKE